MVLLILLAIGCWTDTHSRQVGAYFQFLLDLFPSLMPNLVALLVWYSLLLLYFLLWWKKRTLFCTSNCSSLGYSQCLQYSWFYLLCYFVWSSIGLCWWPHWFAQPTPPVLPSRYSLTALTPRLTQKCFPWFINPWLSCYPYSPRQCRCWWWHLPRGTQPSPWKDVATRVCNGTLHRIISLSLFMSCPLLLSDTMPSCFWSRGRWSAWYDTPSEESDWLCMASFHQPQTGQDHQYAKGTHWLVGR